MSRIVERNLAGSRELVFCKTLFSRSSFSFSRFSICSRRALRLLLLEGARRSSMRSRHVLELLRLLLLLEGGP